MADLQQDPARLFRSLLQSFTEASLTWAKLQPESMFCLLGPAGWQNDLGAITIALEGAFKIKGDEFLEGN
jgi:hypothetical protein